MNLEHEPVSPAAVPPEALHAETPARRQALQALENRHPDLAFDLRRESTDPEGNLESFIFRGDVPESEGAARARFFRVTPRNVGGWQIDEISLSPQEAFDLLSS